MRSRLRAFFATDAGPCCRADVLAATSYAIGSWVIAYIVHRSARGVTFPVIPYEMLWWLPIAFALQSTFAAILAVVSGRHRNAVLGLDLMAWSGPFLVLLGARLQPNVASLTLAVAIFIKIGAGLGGVWLVLRDEAVHNRLAGWAIAIQSAVFSVVSVPFVRGLSPAGLLTGDAVLHHLVIACSVTKPQPLCREHLSR